MERFCKRRYKSRDRTIKKIPSELLFISCASSDGCELVDLVCFSWSDISNEMSTFGALVSCFSFISSKYYMEIFLEHIIILQSNTHDGHRFPPFLNYYFFASFLEKET